MTTSKRGFLTVDLPNPFSGRREPCPHCGFRIPLHAKWCSWCEKPVKP